MAERTWFRTEITMQPFCLQATMNVENDSLSRTRDTQAVDSLARFGFIKDITQVVGTSHGRLLCLPCSWACLFRTCHFRSAKSRLTLSAKWLPGEMSGCQPHQKYEPAHGSLF